MTFAGKIRSHRYRPGVAALTGAYAESVEREQRLAIQLELWNAEWARLRAVVPYYEELGRQRRLPERFTSWQEVVTGVPATTRAAVQKNRAAMTTPTPRPDGVSTTGGSTAQPVQLPTWRSEPEHTRYNRWVARGWYGLSPASRTFWLWGHSHLLGTGAAGWLRRQRQRLRDRLIGSHRFSAYDLRPEALRQAADELVRFRPDCVFGYSVALDLFARANRSRQRELRNLGLTVVLATAESFPSPDSRALLEELFGCPVAMEYGAVETDLLAHEHPDGGYRTLWRTYFLEAERVDAAGTGMAVRVTSLYPRSFPLVRYELGDEIAMGDSARKQALGIDAFGRVIGRCNDYVTLSDGAVVHSELFSHALRNHAGITGFQVVLGPDSRLALHYVPAKSSASADLSDVSSRLNRIHPELERIELVEVPRLEQTTAGKTRMVRTVDGR